MAGTSTSTSSGSGTSSSKPTVIQTPQTEWGLTLSKMLSALGQYQYNWAQNQFQNGMGITDQNISNYMDLAGKGAGLAQNLLSRYENVFEPMMDQFIKQAGTYNSEDRQRFMMGQAESTVGQADEAARNEAERKLQGFGINPNSGRYQDLLMTSRIQDAAARAGAGTQAALNTADRGRQMTEQAAQMGQNVPGMTVNALQSAYTGVTGAENAILGMLNTGANLTQSAAPFMNAASGAIKVPPVGQNSTSQNQQRSNSGSVQNDPSRSSGNQNQNPRQPTDASGGPSKSNGSMGGSKSSGPGFGKGVGPGEKEDDGSGADTPDQGPVWSPFTVGYPGANGGEGIDPWDPSTYAPNWGSNPAWEQDPNLGVQPSTQGPGETDWGAQPSIPDSFPGDNQVGVTQDNSPQWQQGQQDNSDPWAGVPTGGGNFGQLPGGQDFGSPDIPTGSTPDYQPDFNDAFGQFGQGQQGGYQQPDYGSDFGQQDFSQPDQGPQQYNDSGDQGGYGQQQSQDSGFTGSDGGYGGGGGGYGGYAGGGKVRPRQGVLPSTGGHVPAGASPSRGRTTDDIPARLNAGEFVMPRDVVAHKGSEFFTNLIKKSRQSRLGMAGPPPKPKMKPALRMRPNFVSRGM